MPFSFLGTRWSDYTVQRDACSGGNVSDDHDLSSHMSVYGSVRRTPSLGDFRCLRVLVRDLGVRRETVTATESGPNPRRKLPDFHEVEILSGYIQYLTLERKGYLLLI